MLKSKCNDTPNDNANVLMFSGCNVDNFYILVYPVSVLMLQIHHKVRLRADGNSFCLAGM